jgi:copper transport protein
MSKAAAKLAALLGLALAHLATPGAALGQGAHPTHTETDRGLIVGGLTHGLVQGSVVFLVGLAVFAALVWAPASRSVGSRWDADRLFGRAAWVLFGLLVVAGSVELSLYAVRASGEPFSPGLLWQALLETRVGHVWLARLGFALLTALAAYWASQQEGDPHYWWAAVAVGGILLMSLTQLSHAAAEGGFLPLFSDWLHVAAASAWMGGLLGFPLLLLGPLRAMPTEARAELLGRVVRRFSKVATVAVATVVATGIYATLLHIPSLSALLGSPYGRALIMKLGLLVFLLAIGGINLIDKGREPLFGRMVGAELLLAIGVFVAAGFLTSVPPPAP